MLSIRKGRPAGWLAALALLGAATTAATATAARQKQPTRTQIQAAISRAERSPDLWATVNICNTARYPNVIGIRGQMPALGFPSRLSMTVAVEYYDATAKRFKPTGASTTVGLGRNTTAVHQGGVRFTFNPTAGQKYQLRGVVTFEWRSGPKLLGRAVRHTRRGERHVDFADPAGFSASTCVLG